MGLSTALTRPPLPLQKPIDRAVRVHAMEKAIFAQHTLSHSVDHHEPAFALADRRHAEEIFDVEDSEPPHLEEMAQQIRRGAEWPAGRCGSPDSIGATSP